jgi:hypothetical protein
MAAIGGTVSASLVHGQSNLAEGGESSAIGIEGSQENYPDGSKWTAPQYEKPKAELSFRLEEMVHGGPVSSAYAGKIQGELPAGITLGPANAIRFSQDVPSQRLTGAQVKDGTQTTDSPTPQMPAKQTIVKWFVDYPVLYKGVPLSKVSDVLVVAGGDGRVEYLRKRNLPRAVDATQPTVDKKVAVGTGESHAKTGFARQSPRSSEPSLEVWVDPDLRGHLAWSFTVEGDSPADPKARRYWVSAVGAPQVIYWESLIYTTHFGTVSGTLWPTTPLQPTANGPLGNLTVNRTGGGGGSVVTGTDGRYGFPSGGGAATISATLSGPHSVVANLAGPVMTESKSGTPAAAIDLNFGGATEFEFAQVSAFYWTNFIHAFANDILLPTDLAVLPTNVNINSTCNAFWSGSSINFFRAGGGCPNTAYPDVVLHEYGHGIDQSKGGILDGRYSEGFGDSMAILGTRQPCVGRDFFGAGTCLRLATNVDLWPSSSPDPHEVGKRYMEFVWQLVQELKKRESEEDSFQITSHLVLAAAAANPNSIPDAVRLMYIADDDDGNLSNGTPHCRELSAAADSRNLPHPPCPPEKLAYAWANQPNTGSYTPAPPYSYNSGGGPITITRSGEGAYAVTFGGLGGNGVAGGNVQVTPYGSGREHCKVLNWSSGGADFIAHVRCFNSLGIPDDTRFTILVVWH